MFARMGRTMTPNNEKQAWLPGGSMLIENPRGTACGFRLDAGACRLYFMPGVPHEMKAMFEAAVLPDLRARLEPEPVRVAGFRTFGLGESKVGSLLEDLRAEPPGALFIQYRAAFPEVHVRLCLTGFAADDPAGDRELERLADEAARRLGHAVFTRGEESLPAVVLELLKARNATLSVAESCTGGLLSSLLTAVPGSSEAFEGGVVSYSNTLKQTLLDVPAELLEAHGAVSRPVAETMASGARAHLGTTWALAITGIAGPGGGSAEKPVGTVYIALAGPEGVQAKHQFFAGDRDRVRTYSAYTALEMLRRALEGRLQA
jgi:nicotinamide-nucleotide amidase